MDVLKQDPQMADSDVTLEYLADNTWLVGDPDEVVRRIRALRADVGDFGTLLVIGHEWEPREAWTRSMRLLVERGAPAPVTPNARQARPSPAPRPVDRSIRRLSRAPWFFRSPSTGASHMSTLPPRGCRSPTSTRPRSSSTSTPTSTTWT